VYFDLACFAESLGIDLGKARRMLRQAGADSDDVLQESLVYAWQRQQRGKPVKGCTAIRTTLRKFRDRGAAKRQLVSLS
jgi:DNA-directed RNA polymerase specialized sigma24 family protein